MSAAAEWLTAIGTIGAVAAAVGMQFWITHRQDRRRPVLTLTYRDSDRQTEYAWDGEVGWESLYLRLRVENPVGKDAAESVQVLVSTYEKAWPEENEPLVNLGYLPLTWTHRQDDRTHISVPPGSSRLIDLCCSTRPDEKGVVAFPLCVSSPPNTGTSILSSGVYFMNVELAARNADARRYVLRVGLYDAKDATVETIAPFKEPG